MIVPKIFLLPFFLVLVIQLYFPVAAFSQAKTTTERECALTKDAEIIWDLSEHQWFCCVPKDDELESCLPITDMKPLKKTSLKPLPPPGKKTIIISPGDPN